MQKPIALDCLDLFSIPSFNDYINHLNALWSKTTEIVNLPTIIIEEFKVSNVISGSICTRITILYQSSLIS